MKKLLFDRDHLVSVIATELYDFLVSAHSEK